MSDDKSKKSQDSSKKLTKSKEAIDAKRKQMLGTAGTPRRRTGPAWGSIPQVGTSTSSGPADPSQSSRPFDANQYKVREGTTYSGVTTDSAVQGIQVQILLTPPPKEAPAEAGPSGKKSKSNKAREKSKSLPKARTGDKKGKEEEKVPEKERKSFNCPDADNVTLWSHLAETGQRGVAPPSRPPVAPAGPAAPVATTSAPAPAQTQASTSASTSSPGPNKSKSSKTKGRSFVDKLLHRGDKNNKSGSPKGAVAADKSKSQKKEAEAAKHQPRPFVAVPVDGTSYSQLAQTGRRTGGQQQQEASNQAQDMPASIITSPAPPPSTAATWTPLTPPPTPTTDLATRLRGRPAHVELPPLGVDNVGHVQVSGQQRNANNVRGMRQQQANRPQGRRGGRARRQQVHRDDAELHAHHDYEDFGAETFRPARGDKVEPHYNPLLKGINGQLKKKNRALQADDFLNNYRVLQDDAKLKQLQQKRLHDAIIELIRGPHVTGMRTQIVNIVHQEHRRRLKPANTGEIAEHYFNEAFAIEALASTRRPDYEHQFGRAFTAQLQRAEKREANRLYVRAISYMRYPDHHDLYVQALRGRIRVMSKVSAKIDLIRMYLTLTKGAPDAQLALQLARCHMIVAKKYVDVQQNMIAKLRYRFPKQDHSFIPRNDEEYDDNIRRAKAEICRAIEWAQPSEARHIVAKAAEYVGFIENLEYKWPLQGVPPPEQREQLWEMYEQSTNVRANVDVDGQFWLRARKQIAPGKVVFFERPVCFYNKHYLCPGCWRPMGANLFPCSGCCEVFYCDFRCQLMNASRHQRICGFTRYLRRAKGPIDYMTYELVVGTPIETICNFGHAYFFGNEAVRYESLNVGNVIMGGQIYEGAKFTGRVHAVMLSFAMSIAFWTLEHLSQLGRDKLPTSIVTYVAGVYLVYRSLFHQPTARFPLTSQQLQFSDARRVHRTQVAVGYGLGTFGGRIRRSCAPNVVRTFDENGRIVYTASRVIEEKQPLLFDCCLFTRWARASMAYAMPRRSYCCKHIKDQNGGPQLRRRQRGRYRDHGGTQRGQVYRRNFNDNDFNPGDDEIFNRNDVGRQARIYAQFGHQRRRR